MTLKTLAGKLLLFPIAIENWIVLSIGIAGTMTWLIGELEPGSSDPRNFILLAFFTFFRLLTIIFLIFGGLAWSLRWMRNRILTSPLGAKGGNFQPWLFLVIIILLVHGALAVVFAYPLPRLFQETIQLLERLGVWEGLRKGGELSGLHLIPALGILMAPCMALLVAFSFCVGAFVTLGYLLLGIENISRVLLRSISLQIAFLSGLFFTLNLFDAGIQSVAGGLTEQFATENTQILTWLTGQIEDFSPLVWHFVWLLPGFFICAAILIRQAQQRSLPDENETVRPFTEQVPMHMPERLPMHVHQETLASEPTQGKHIGRLVEMDERFKDKWYLVKYKFFSNPFYKDFDVYDSSNNVVFTARMNALNPVTRDIVVYEVNKARSEILLISGKHFIRWPNNFEMTCIATGEKIGTFRNGPAGWAVLDEYGRQVAILKRIEDPSGAIMYQIRMDSTSVCEYRFINIITPVIMIDFPDESIFSKKMGIGLALVLGYQSVAFNYTYQGW